eukprot:4549608-Pleurochrysis_carterae.AAC.1
MKALGLRGKRSASGALSSLSRTQIVLLLQAALFAICLPLLACLDHCKVAVVDLPALFAMTSSDESDGFSDIINANLS